MKKTIKVTMFTLLIAIQLAVPIKANAACSGWTSVGTPGKSYCEMNDGCGFLWTKGTKTQRGTQERYCDIDGKQVRETKYYPIKSGCC